jgi:hypothetical protein
LCPVKIIGSKISDDSYIKEQVIQDMAREMNGIKRDIRNIDKDGLAVIFGLSAIFAGGGMIVGGLVVSREPSPLSFGCYAGLGIACGWSGITGMVIDDSAQSARESLKKYGSKFELIDQPLISLEEQKCIKKVEQEAQEKREQKVREKEKLELVAYLKRKPISVKQYKPVELKKLLVKDALCLKNLE